MKALRSLLAVLLLAFGGVAASAANVAVTLVAEPARPAPGKPLTLALTFAPKPTWHTYWKNPGDAGIETQAKWTLPAGASAGALRYPVPGTLLVSGLMNYVYEAKQALLVDIAVPATAAPGSAFPVRAKIDYLVCTDEICVPESATVAADLTVGDGAPDPAQAATFAEARRALPVKLAERARYSVTGGRIALAVPMAGLDRVTKAYFFPAADGIADYSAAQTVTVAGDTLRIETKAQDKPSGTIAGVLRIERAGEAPRGFEVVAEPGAVPAAGTALSSAPTDTGPLAAAFLPAFLLAVAGGILLNVMPCVFPILSLKALSLAKGNVDAATARRDALAYAAGVVLVCTALGAAILGLRAAGTQVGWAFQLQTPEVILGLLLLTTAIALNLAGVFEVALPGGGAGQSLTARPGAAGSFWTGALAAFVATPCTGPFMAGALGAALVLPPLAGLLVFAGLGLGLALPFVLIAFVPALRRRLPKPSAWMATFRRILSVPMFATALALAWVLGRQAGVEGMTLGLVGAVTLGLLLWWLGSTQGSGRRSWLPLGGAVVAAVIAIAALPPGGPATAREADAPAALAAEPFSEARLAALRAAGTPTFVYFTADWCLTCKVNEKGALADADVASAFRSAGVATLVGDWTNGDAAIGRFIDARGAAGVPLYLFYRRGDEPVTLPQILTSAKLVEVTRS